MDDIFHNIERLIYAMEDLVEGTAIDCVLKALATVLKGS